MDAAEALKILRCLADGFDPITGEVFGKESPYQNTEVVRALFAAIEGLQESSKTRKRTRVLPERAGKKWEDEEVQQLLAEFDSGQTMGQIAKAHKRTRWAIAERLMRLGKMVLKK